MYISKSVVTEGRGQNCRRTTERVSNLGNMVASAVPKSRAVGGALHQKLAKARVSRRDVNPLSTGRTPFHTKGLEAREKEVAQLPAVSAAGSTPTSTG